MAVAGLDSADLLRSVRQARARLPAQHRALLDQIDVQEAAVDDWPSGVQDLYRTVRHEPPDGAALSDVGAVWLGDLRVVAFNVQGLGRATEGLTEIARDSALTAIAWHEYGHALSVTRSSFDQRREGLRLLSLLGTRMRESIKYPDGYRSSEVFDEVIATVYVVMIARLHDNVRGDVYGCPTFLHPDVFEAFKEVIPWPPSR